MRWVVPASMGAAMPAGLMLRNRMANGFITQDQVLALSREDLSKSGPVVATITARAVEPLSGTFAGIIVRLDGDEPHDRTPADDPSTNPLSPGIPNYDYYSLEVVQRIGYDSFTPDSGVLIAKNKNAEGNSCGYNCFTWVIDAHPEDINMVDFKRPKSGEPVIVTGCGTSEHGAQGVAEILRDGRPYLTGDRFTAADLTFAALATPVVFPEHYARYAMPFESMSPAIREIVERHRATPAGRFALRMYEAHRAPA